MEGSLQCAVIWSSTYEYLVVILVWLVVYLWLWWWWWWSIWSIWSINLLLSLDGEVNIWLVVYLPLRKMMKLVSWDDDIPNVWKNNPHVPNHQLVVVTLVLVTVPAVVVVTEGTRSETSTELDGPVLSITNSISTLRFRSKNMSKGSLLCFSTTWLYLKYQIFTFLDN